jgi:superfamily II DNA or RNA helicase
MMRNLIADDDRNMIIAKVIAKEVQEGNYCLCLSRQIKHLQNISDCLWQVFDGDEGWLQYVNLVTGKQSRTMQAKAIKELTEGKINCILGTQMFEEGVDIPRLNRIMLAYPGTDITVLQKIGRGSRQHKGKTETIVYDFVDDFVPVLGRQWSDRKTWYKRNSIKIGSVMRNGKDGQLEVKQQGPLLKGPEFIRSLRVARA